MELAKRGAGAPPRISLPSVGLHDHPPSSPPNATIISNVMLTRRILLGVAVALCLASCRRADPPRVDREVQHVTIKNVKAERVTFFSPGLQRRMHYLIVWPSDSASHQNGLAVLYLLHGLGGAPQDWLRWSHLYDYLRDRRMVAVLAEGNNSYWVNAAEIPEDRYEDYIVRDLPADVESHYSVARTRDARAIAGLSMGGYGAFYLGLRHPDRYWFIGSMSNAADAPSRPFSVHRFGQYWRLRKIFGPLDSTTRAGYSPYHLVKSVESPAGLPYIYLACGTKDGLIGPNRQLDEALSGAHIDHVYREGAGAHNWRFWDQALRGMFEVMDKVSPATSKSPNEPDRAVVPPQSGFVPSHRQSSP